MVSEHGIVLDALDIDWSSIEVDDPHVEHAWQAAVAAGASVQLQPSTSVPVGKTGRLIQVVAAASVPLKIEVEAYDGAAAVTLAVLFTSEAVLTESWNPRTLRETELAGGAGVRFRAQVTNLDTADAADVHATFSWDEADA